MRWMTIALIATSTGLAGQERTRVEQINAERDQKEQNFRTPDLAP